jgi:hypothetical protein
MESSGSDARFVPGEPLARPGTQCGRHREPVRALRSSVPSWLRRGSHALGKDRTLARHEHGGCPHRPRSRSTSQHSLGQAADRSPRLGASAFALASSAAMIAKANPSALPSTMVLLARTGVWTLRLLGRATAAGSCLPIRGPLTTRHSWETGRVGIRVHAADRGTPRQGYCMPPSTSPPPLLLTSYRAQSLWTCSALMLTRVQLPEPC